ncbi:hypothetical protein T440DRAFT_503389 [Plenodomus tracheiphilus IPT5]|uniref:Uncharacterized protein n=1 Tax=Plenodomus tracheiphilus IPT5 TaxID=1408161 RepID=A0A6A7BPC6_9PLEO|nr:hypothetical protein T440DRAFT_503389 [Plenodomus tracheiphilus IPT5]
MAAQKRTRSGRPKFQTTTQNPDITMTDATPPCAQHLPPSSKTTEIPTITLPQESSKPLQNPLKPHPNPPKTARNPPKPRPNKMPKLPPTATLTKRPILHPPLPTPFASAASPKIIYITASTPYIPALKRVRKLLAEIEKRAKQSSSSAFQTRGGARRGAGIGSGKTGFAEANGRLEAGAVEKDIVEGVRGGKGGKAGEEVFLKATGRAMARALEVGVYFQGEVGYKVRVEMGSVRAVDDVEVGEGEDVPETRIRTLSSVTVSIGVR